MKKPVSATIDTNIIKWLDETVKNSSMYRNKSHLIEIALEEFRKKSNQEKVVIQKRGGLWQSMK